MDRTSLAVPGIWLVLLPFSCLWSDIPECIAAHCGYIFGALITAEVLQLLSLYLDPLIQTGSIASAGTQAQLIHSCVQKVLSGAQLNCACY